jgi:hypothetical protein
MAHDVAVVEPHERDAGSVAEHDARFCASSRMMNESLSVRPRMNASGATSIVPRSSIRRARSKSTMSCSAS